MRQQVAPSVFASAVFALGGCSLIYNPSNLPDSRDGGPKPIDAEPIVDANPLSLALTDVFPAVVSEGTGANGSRKAILTINGTDIAPDATVAVTRHGTMMPFGTVDNSSMERVAGNAKMIAVPMTVPVDPALPAGAKIRLDVTVTQMTSEGMKSVTLSELDGGAPVLEVVGLDELTDPAVVQNGGEFRFSQVMINGGIAMPVGSMPLRITATSSITISGAVTANSINTMGVGGGGDGGQGGDLTNGATAGTGRGPGNTGGGAAGGGGGGHKTAGGGEGGGAAYGDEQMTAQYPGSGGGGGSYSGLNGSAGGGGGGMIELTAGGNLTVGNVQAKGGAAGTANNDGGGGSGGSILLRSFATISAPAVDVSGGGPASSAGAPGRSRFDAAAGTATGFDYRGPMFAASTPLITRVDRPSFMVVGQPDQTFTYRYEDDEATHGPFQASIGSNGTNMITLPEGLGRGINTLCLFAKNAEPSNTNPSARTCIDIAYLIPPQ